MVGAFLAALLVWRLVIRPLLDRLPQSVKASSDSVAANSVSAIVAFCRPHTVKGTILASVSGYVLLSIHFRKQALDALFLVVLGGVFANIFIVGINQLVDVDSDRTNKKPLPIATGALEWSLARDIVGFSFLAAITAAYWQSLFWGHVVSGMCFVGFLYSVPPIRLKRFALPAALCIVTARALLGTVGGALTLCEALEVALDENTRTHLVRFTGIMVVFTTVIALMKDVPDVEGDVQDGVRSLSVTVGPGKVSDICYALLTCMYCVVVSISGISSLAGFLHSAALVWLWGASHPRNHLGGYSSVRKTAMHNYFSVIWPLFYFEFVAYLFPIAAEPLFRVPIPLVSLLLGIEVGSLYWSPKFSKPISSYSSLLKSIEKVSGLNISSLHANFGLKGEDPSHALADSHLHRAAAEMTVALSMHSRLTNVGVRDAKKLAILCGDWLLAKAVVSLCETKSQAAIQEMGKAIVSATSGPQDEIRTRIFKHVAIVEQHDS